MWLWPLVSLALAAASFAPLARTLWRREHPTPGRLLAPLVVFASAVALGLLVRLAGLRNPLFPSHRDTAFALLAHAVHGVGLGLASLYGCAAWVLSRRGARRLAAAVAVPSIALLAPSVWALMIEPRTLVEVRYVVRSSRAPRRPLRILHVSDLQTDGPCAREEKVDRIAAASTPDFVFFTGDLTNGMSAADPGSSRARVVATRRFLMSLHARYGVLGVLGDWDGWGERWPALLRELTAGSSIRFLDNASASFDVEGTPVTVWGAEGGGPSPSSVIANMRETPGFRVVLAHHPDRVVERYRPGYADLILAGHTHGGQIVLPFVGALITHNAHGFVGGMYRHDDTPMIVSRGIGMRGGLAPRVRFRCPPEVGWITVRR